MGLFSFKKKVNTEVESEKSGSFIQELDKSSELEINFQGYQANSEKYCSETLQLMYESVSQVSSLINYIATKGAEIPIRHYKYQSNGKKKWLGETEIQKFIDNISIQDLIIQFIVHGNVFIQKYKTPGFAIPTRALIQPSNRFYVIPQFTQDQYGTPITTKDVFENDVTGYKKLIDSGILKSYKKEEIIHIKDNQVNKNGRDYYYGTSRLYAAASENDTLKYLSETINTILSKKGALGFISRNSKTNEVDPMMYQELTKKAEKKINNSYGTTGGRRSIMVSVADLKWNEMASPMNNYLPIELTAQGFRQLCNQIGGVPDILFNAVSNATYNNMNEAKSAMYENVLSPILTHLYTEISKDLGITILNEWIEPDFSEVAAMQKDKKTEAEAQKIEDEMIRARYDNNEITLNDKLTAMGLQPMADGNKYKKDIEVQQTINAEDNGSEDI